MRHIYSLGLFLNHVNPKYYIYKQWNVVATSHDDKPQETTWETWKLTYQDDKNFSASNLDDPDSRSYGYTFVEILDLSESEQ